MIPPPICPTCHTVMPYVYAVQVTSQHATVKVFLCRGCAQRRVQTWIGDDYVGEGETPPFVLDIRV